MKALVVGLGSMGRRRLRNLTHLGGHELAGVEPSDERRASVGEEFGIPTFGSLEDGLAWAPDSLIISTPPDQHFGYALEAARNGISFFMEAGVPDDRIGEVVAEAERAGVVAAPSCTMRFHPAVQRLKQQLAADAIGRPTVLTYHVGQYLPDWHPWEDYRTFYIARRETGAARELVPFELNWMTYLFGDVASAACIRGKLSDLEVDIDDVYTLMLSFANGLHASVVIEVISRPAVRQARVVGTEGTLLWDWNEKIVRQYRVDGEKWEEFPDPPPVQGPGGTWVAENMYIAEMEAFARAVADGQEHWPFSLAAERTLLDLVVELEDRSAASS